MLLTAFVGYDGAQNDPQLIRIPLLRPKNSAHVSDPWTRWHRLQAGPEVRSKPTLMLVPQGPDPRKIRGLFGWVPVYESVRAKKVHKLARKA
jgi:hypothetical protein